MQLAFTVDFSANLSLRDRYFIRLFAKAVRKDCVSTEVLGKMDNLLATGDGAMCAGKAVGRESTARARGVSEAQTLC